MAFSLKTILTINAVASLPFALLLIAYPSYIAELSNLPDASWVTGVGVFILFFSLAAFISGKKESVPGAKLISLLDISWVVCSVLLVAINPLAMSGLASTMVLLVAAFVVFCAYFQCKAIQRKHAVVEA